MQNSNNNAIPLFLTIIHYLFNTISNLQQIISQLTRRILRLEDELNRQIIRLDEMDTQLEEEKLNRQISEWRLNTLMEEEVDGLIEERNELRQQVNQLQYENSAQFREIFWLKSLSQQNDDEIIETQSV